MYWSQPSFLYGFDRFRREIAARRNELLGQMYRLMRQRDGLASILDEDENKEEESEGLKIFLGQFDLQKAYANPYLLHMVALSWW